MPESGREGVALGAGSVPTAQVGHGSGGIGSGARVRPVAGSGEYSAGPFLSPLPKVHARQVERVVRTALREAAAGKDWTSKAWEAVFLAKGKPMSVVGRPLWELRIVGEYPLGIEGPADIQAVIMNAVTILASVVPSVKILALHTYNGLEADHAKIVGVHRGCECGKANLGLVPSS